MREERKGNFWNTPLTASMIKTKDVRMPEMLLGYFIGPIGGLLSSGIFTSILNTYFTDVLKLDLTFLTTLQLVSTIFIVIANLIVGQLDRTDKSDGGQGKTVDPVIGIDAVGRLCSDVHRTV